jgi:signal transduction histidine kinase
MNLLNWFSDGSGGGAGWLRAAPGPSADWRWASVTLGLSALIVIGYCLIAVNWYFQSRMSRRDESHAALRRLINICLTCAICGFIFYQTDMPWLVWRFYDFALLVFALRTWAYVARMRGWSLVDERLAQMAELEKSATKYREIAELLPHIVWTATSDGRVDFSNQRWRHYIGATSMTTTWLDAIHPEDRAEALSRWHDAVNARQPVTIEARLGGAEGYRTFVIKATTIAHGDAVKWLGACADIEDQKLLAAEKEKQARQKSFFLNALSHDLRAPLHNVLLNAHLLKLQATQKETSGDGGDDAATAGVDLESVAMIMENAVAAGDLVTRLLDFAKVGAQDHNATETVQLDGLLHQIARRFQPIAEQKGLSLTLDAPERVALLTDRQKLERVVSNLVDNGIKYTSRGGITIGLLVHSDAVCIRVTDTGIGIPDANVPYLFDEFYQVNNHERDRSKGFGMGLAICKSLAGHIGAQVRLVSTGVAGTCFELRIERDISEPGADADVVIDQRGDAEAVRADRGGRQVGAAGDQRNPAPAGLCGIGVGDAR